MGRPRNFEVEDALENAMLVFWEKGYDGASLTDLTEAMNMSRPSMYSIFGNKEELFYKALDRYAKGPATFWREVMDEPTAREVIERLMYSVADSVTEPGKPTGCLTVQAALACSKTSQSIHQVLNTQRAKTTSILENRLEKAQVEGDFPHSINPASFAQYVTTVTQGLCVKGAEGVSREQLYEIVKIALLAYPS
jgi:AcrR family transcriptional regulator